MRAVATDEAHLVVERQVINICLELLPFSTTAVKYKVLKVNEFCSANMF